jgi:hypothetical protein
MSVGPSFSFSSASKGRGNIVTTSSEATGFLVDGRLAHGAGFIGSSSGSSPQSAVTMRNFTSSTFSSAFSSGT